MKSIRWAAERFRFGEGFALHYALLRFRHIAVSFAGNAAQIRRRIAGDFLRQGFAGLAAVDREIRRWP